MKRRFPRTTARAGSPIAVRTYTGPTSEHPSSAADWANEHDRLIRLLEVEAILDDCL